MDEGNAKTLLQSTQSLRIHWSDMIFRHFGYAIITFSAIWSYLFKEYISKGANETLPLVAAAAISAIFLGLWRISSRRIDSGIVGLYGDFIYYEDRLSVPEEIGTWGYLNRHVFRKNKSVFKDKNLSGEQKMNIVICLSDMKRMGSRGHFGIDLTVTIYIITSLLIGGYHFISCQQHGGIVELLMASHLVALILSCYAMLGYQKDPDKSDIKKVIDEVIKGAKGNNN